MTQQFITVPVLETERLIMRGHTKDDFDSYVELWSDEEVVRHISGKTSSHMETWGRLGRTIGFWQLNGFGYWAVIEKASGRYVGEVGFCDFHREIEPSIIGRPEAGWVLSPWSHGKGYATEAVKAALDWGLPRFGKNTPVCIMDPDYTATFRVAEKCGFVGIATAICGDQKMRMMEYPQK